MVEMPILIFLAIERKHFHKILQCHYRKTYDTRVKDVTVLQILFGKLA